MDLQGQPSLHQAVLGTVKLPQDSPLKGGAKALHFLQEGIVFKSRQFCRCRGGWCPQICGKISDGKIRFVSHGGNDGSLRIKDSPGHLFLIEGPQVFDGTSAPSHDEHVKAHLIQGPDPPYDAVRRIPALHQGGIEDQLHIWIPPPGYVADILNGGSRGSSYDADPHGISRDRLFVAGIEHPHLLKLLLQLFEALVKLSPAGKGCRSCVKLIAPRLLIDGDLPPDLHLLSVTEAEAKPLPVPCEHDAGDGSSLILQGKINMTGGVIFTVADFALYTDIGKGVIPYKQVFDICVDL